MDVSLYEISADFLKALDGLEVDEETGEITNFDAVEALKNGQVDCVILDNEPAKALVAANEGLHILDTEYAVEDYAIAIAKELGVPVKYAGVGEGIDDLKPFDAMDFAQALI